MGHAAWNKSYDDDDAVLFLFLGHVLVQFHTAFVSCRHIRSVLCVSFRLFVTNTFDFISFDDDDDDDDDICQVYAYLCDIRHKLVDSQFSTKIMAVGSELSMRPFCVTRSNPTHQLTKGTQPNALQVDKFGPNPTQPDTTNKFNCLVQPNFI